MLNFTFSELVHSDTAARYNINNMPDLKASDNLLKLIHYCLQPLRTKSGIPMVITSGYRCPQLNKRIGGSTTSHHCLGCAADFHFVGKSIAWGIDFIRKSGVPFTQLIDEGNWIHLSFVPDNLKCEVLLYKNGKYSKI